MGSGRALRHRAGHPLLPWRGLSHLWPKHHRALVSCLSRSADAPVLSVGYRMLPRYPISSAVADALDGYRWLCETGYGDGDIVVAGDSAGGYLAFMTALS